MSSSLEESADSTLSCAGQSFTKALDLPDLFSTLRIIRVPSSGSKSIPLVSNNAETTPVSSLMENSASTTQESPSEPIAVTSAFSPSKRDKAPRIMDFPAPVSPVSTVMPLSKVKEISSMMAKFLMEISNNMPAPF